MKDHEDRTGDLVRRARKNRKLTQAELAKKAGINQVTISRIESGQQNPTVNIIMKLAEVLNVGPEVLLVEKQPDLPEGAMPVRRVPLLSWIKAGEFFEFTDKDFPAGYAEEWVETTAKGDKVFALRVRGDSMAPEFQEGEIIVVDPDKEVLHGQYGVVKNLETNETTLKRVEYYDSMVVLRPLNPAYSPIEIKNGQKRIQVIGKVVRKEKSY